MQNSLKAYALYPLAEKFLKRDIRSKLSTLREEHSRAPEIRQERQKKQLHQILTIAKAKVPYYRDLFTSIRFNPDKILKSTQYLEEVPLLDKEILREHSHRLLNEDMQIAKLHSRKTNGSTGLTTNIFYDQVGLDWTSAANLFASELGGRKRSLTEVSLLSKIAKKSSWKEQQLERLKCLTLNRTLVYTDSFDEAGLIRTLDEVKAAQPFTVHGHPSTLYFMALEALKHGDRFKNLFKCFEPTGESLDQQKVQTIESAFNCKVFNRYGNAEFGVIAHSLDNYNKLQVLDYIVFPESHSLGNGLEELIFTGLTNTAMPLIRYKTGDIGEITKSEKMGFELSNLSGRVHDIVYIDDQAIPTSYIKDILEQVGGVDEFQVVANDKNIPVVLKIVPHDNMIKGEIERKIFSTFGKNMKIEYTNFEGLILSGWRDKFRYLVQGTSNTCQAIQRTSR